MKTYHIFPGIGIARLGNSPDEYYIGPEAPGISGAPGGGSYRDQNEHLKRQGARFRIYEFETDSSGRARATREITTNDAKIEWSVQLVNSKAAAAQFPPEFGKLRNPHIRDREQLIIRSGRKIGGSSQVSSALEGNFKGNPVKLGNLRTDQLGRLIALGGHGCSRSFPDSQLNHYANNPDWHDDVSDGPVTATVQFSDEAPREVEAPAWVVVAPPAYAPEIRNITTWYDQAENVDVKFFNPPLTPVRPSFSRDIYPILERTVLLQWTSETARYGHSQGHGNFLSRLNKLSDNSPSAEKEREDIFRRLTAPFTPARGPQELPVNMPNLYSGVNPKVPDTYVYASLTPLQYDVMKLWSDGIFEADWHGAPTQTIPFDQIHLNEQPAALNRAALEDCIGGPFFPGIESGYVVAQAQTYEAPFRIDRGLEAGYLTRGLALPWQADFLACGKLWWPAQRPVNVKRGGWFQSYTPDNWKYPDIVANWWKLGFVLRSGSEFIEDQRVPI